MSDERRETGDEGMNSIDTMRLAFAVFCYGLYSFDENGDVGIGVLLSYKNTCER